GHVRVLLRLRDPELRFSRCTNDFAQDATQIFRTEYEGTLIGHIVSGHGDELGQRPDFAIESVEIRQEKSLRQLPGTIGAEVNENNHVAIADALFVRMGEN